MFFMYYFFYGTSFAKVPWVYNSEVNSLGWRTRGAAAATATNWMGGFIVTQFTKVGVDNLHWGFYLSKSRIASPYLERAADRIDSSSLCVDLLCLLPRGLLCVPGNIATHAGGHGRDLHSEPVCLCVRPLRHDTARAATGIRRGRGAADRGCRDNQAGHGSQRRQRAEHGSFRASVMMVTGLVHPSNAHSRAVGRSL